MSYDRDKAAEMALALMYLTSFKEKGGGVRAWKSLSWDITDHLFEKGYISDPKGKAKSVWLTDEGARLAEELFRKHFGLGDPIMPLFKPDPGTAPELPRNAALYCQQAQEGLCDSDGSG